MNIAHWPWLRRGSGRRVVLRLRTEACLAIKPVDAVDAGRLSLPPKQVEQLPISEASSLDGEIAQPVPGIRDRHRQGASVFKLDLPLALKINPTTSRRQCAIFLQSCLPICARSNALVTPHARSRQSPVARMLGDVT